MHLACTPNEVAVGRNTSQDWFRLDRGRHWLANAEPKRSA
jgi:hypothetical protein